MIAEAVTRTGRVRDFGRWGMLSLLMPHIAVRPGLLAAAATLPLLAGCAALGVAEGATSLDLAPTTGEFDPVATQVAAPSPFEVSSNDGYTLTLPAGWVGTRTNNQTTRAVFEALSVADPLLGEEAGALYGATDADLSMVAADASEIPLTSVPSMMAILVIPSRGAEDTQNRLEDTLAGLATATSEIGRSVTSVRAGDAQRYDLTVAGDMVTAQLRLYLFTIGDDGIVILFASDPAIAGDASADMDAIVKSLRFGV